MKQILFLIIFLSLTANSFSVSEDSTKPENKIKSEENLYFIDGAFFFIDEDFQISGKVGINAIVNDFIYTARVSFIDSELSFFGEPKYHYNDYGFLFGLVIAREEGYYASSSIGVAYTQTDVRGKKVGGGGAMNFGPTNYESIEHNTIGIPFELQFFVNHEYIGIGLEVFGNINKENSMIGFGVSFQFGKLY